MTDPEPSGGKSADLLSQLRQRRVDSTAAQAQQHATDAGNYWAAASHLAGLRDDTPGVEAVDRALQRFQLGPDALAGDADALRRLAELRSHDIEEGRVAVATAKDLLDEKLQRAANLRAKADELENEARRDAAAAAETLRRAEHSHQQADRLADRLRERGAPLGDDRPAPPPAPRPLRKLRALQHVFVDARPRSPGEVFVSDAQPREGILEVVTEDAPKPEPAPVRDGPRLSPTDDPGPLSDLSWCGPGYAARQLAEQQRAAEQATGEPS